MNMKRLAVRCAQPYRVVTFSPLFVINRRRILKPLRWRIGVSSGGECDLGRIWPAKPDDCSFCENERASTVEYPDLLPIADKSEPIFL